MQDHRLNVAVIIGSTREGRRADVVGRWFIDHVDRLDRYTLDVIDLEEERLPADLPEEVDGRISRYLARLDRADAVVIITPEYNHGYPASLKQAIDLGHDEWFAKPIGFVSYGGVAGGSRAVEQLRQIFPELHAVTVRNAVLLPKFYDYIDAQDSFTPPAFCETAISDMMNQLSWWGYRLREARQVPMLETS